MKMYVKRLKSGKLFSYFFQTFPGWKMTKFLSYFSRLSMNPAQPSYNGSQLF